MQAKDMKQIVSLMAASSHTRITDIAARMNHSHQWLYGRMARQKFSLAELKQLANVCGYELKIEFIDSNGDVITYR